MGVIKFERIQVYGIRYTVYRYIYIYIPVYRNNMFVFIIITETIKEEARETEEETLGSIL
jgi:hypothetical protein